MAFTLHPYLTIRVDPTEPTTRRNMVRRQTSPPLASLEPQRVCLIKPSALGDVVQTLPVLEALRSRWPEAHIAWVVKDCFADLLTDHPQLDAVIPYNNDVSGWAFLKEAARLRRVLKRGRYDLAIDMQGLLRSGLMAAATRAPRRVGFSGSREFATWFYTDTVAVHSRALPVMERYWGPPRRQAAHQPSDGLQGNHIGSINFGRYRNRAHDQERPTGRRMPLRDTCKPRCLNQAIYATY